MKQAENKITRTLKPTSVILMINWLLFNGTSTQKRRLCSSVHSLFQISYTTMESIVAVKDVKT